MKSIEIRTSHNATIQYELANVFHRFMATLIDSGILFFYSLIMQLIVNSMVYRGTSRYEIETSPDESALVILTFFLIPVLFYHFFCEVFFAGQSVGKMALGIKVIKLDGKVPTISDYFLRWSFRIIDLTMTIGGLALMTVSSTAKNQRLGDIVANTTIIRLKPSVSYSIKDILTIKSSKDYVPTYPQVTQLTDDDMLLIKNAIDRVRRYPNKNHKKLVIELAKKSQEILRIPEMPKSKLKFLKVLLQDYIVLTRS